MKHLRSDYDNIQDMGQYECGRIHMGIERATSIGSDEPIFLLRAKDALAPDVVRVWAQLLRDSEGGDQRTADAVEKWADEMEAWGKAQGTKLPDAPHDALRM